MGPHNSVDHSKPDQRFRTAERLRLRDHYRQVYDRKCSCSDRAFTVYAAPNGLKWSRLGRSVSRRVGNAVVRNYVRRRIREAFRTQKDRLPVGYDFIVIPRPQAAQRDWDVARSLKRLMRDAAKKADRKQSPS
ncbi:MAG: ribonuclease P protein component [Phycisphaerae bacterium]